MEREMRQMPCNEGCDWLGLRGKKLKATGYLNRAGRSQQRHANNKYKRKPKYVGATWALFQTSESRNKLEINKRQGWIEGKKGETACPGSGTLLRIPGFQVDRPQWKLLRMMLPNATCIQHKTMWVHTIPKYNKCASKYSQDLQDSVTKPSIGKPEFWHGWGVSAERGQIWAGKSKFLTEFCQNGGKFQRLEAERNGKLKNKVTNCQSRAVKLLNTPNAGDNLHLKRTQSLTHTAYH